MGVATAKIVGKEHAVVLCDVRQDRLDTAATALAEVGITPTVVKCDVTDRHAVNRLFATTAGLGTLASVIHTAGVSPSMGDAEYVIRTNAIGTATINEAFYAARPGIGDRQRRVDGRPSAAGGDDPDRSVPQAMQAPEVFLKDMLAACEIVPEEARSGIAYALSKSFVRWYSSSQAERFTGRGLRIVSVSPGSVDTEMGRLEEKAGAGALVADAAVPRWGTPEEMAELFAFCASDRAGYLTGTDILNDGGVVASMRERARVAAEQQQQ